MISTTVQVNKKLKDELEPRHAEFLYDYPESVNEALTQYGEEVTLRLIKDSITLILQAPARKVLEDAPKGSTESYSSLVAEKMLGQRIEFKRNARGVSSPKISAYQQVLQDLQDPAKKDAVIAKFRELGINLEPDISENGEAEALPQEEGSRRRR